MDVHGMDAAAAALSSRKNKGKRDMNSASSAHAHQNDKKTLATAALSPPRHPSNPPRVAVVTGAAGGIGRALVAELVQRGYHVEALVRGGSSRPRRGGHAHSTATASHPCCTIPPFPVRSGGNGQRVRCIAADLRRAADVERVARDLARVHATVHLLINNAAVCPSDWSVRAFDEAWRVNVRAPAMLLAALTPALCAAAASTPAPTDGTASAPPATLINVSSGDAELLFFGTQLRARLEQLGTPKVNADVVDDDNNQDRDKKQCILAGDILTALRAVVCDVACNTPVHLRDGVIHGPEPAYRLSKACLNALTRCAAVNLAPCGIRVVAACPGDVRTRLMSTATTMQSDPHSVVHITTPERAAVHLINLAEQPNVATGEFYRHGSSIPW